MEKGKRGKGDRFIFDLWKSLNNKTVPFSFAGVSKSVEAGASE